MLLRVAPRVSQPRGPERSNLAIPYFYKRFIEKVKTSVQSRIVSLEYYVTYTGRNLARHMLTCSEG
jgi:hypothetical protein